MPLQQAFWLKLGLLFAMFFSFSNRGSAEQIGVQDLALDMPEGWSSYQQATADGTIFLGLKDGANIINLYVKHDGPFELQSFIQTNASSKMNSKQTVVANNYQWATLNSQHDSEIVVDDHTVSHIETQHVSGFMMRHRGFLYYGYSRAQKADVAQANTQKLLNSLR